MVKEQIQKSLVFVSRRFHSHRLSCLMVTAIFVLCGCALLLPPGGNNRNISIANTKELLSSYSSSTSQLLEKLRRVLAENLLVEEEQEKVGEETNGSVRSKKKKNGKVNKRMQLAKRKKLDLENDDVGESEDTDYGENGEGGMFKRMKGNKKKVKPNFKEKKDLEEDDSYDNEPQEDYDEKIERKKFKRKNKIHKNVDMSGLYTKDVLFELSKNWTLEDTEAEREVMRRRSQKVREVCDNMARVPNYRELPMEKLGRSIVWVVKHDLAWCPIFKAASTTWAKNLLILAGAPMERGRFHAKTREYYPKPDDPEEAEAFLKRAMRLLIVRHPLDRILSAYRDKMRRVKKSDDSLEAFREMQRKVWSSFPDPELPDGYDPRPVQPPLPDQPTFNQFLLKIKEDVSAYWKLNGKYYINLHWRPYWAVCSPCSFNYSVIAKVETLQRDQEFIVRDRRLSDLPLKGKTHSSKFDSFNSTKEATEAYYSRVPRSLLEEIISLYKPDFELFGYSGDDYLKLTIPDI